MNKDQLQLIDWYNSGYGRIALRHGLSEQLMQEWLQDQGYYDTDQDLADRMLREFRAELIGYRVSCLDAIQASVWLLLLSDRDKDHDQTAELINTVCFDVVYNIAELVNIDGTGLHRAIMTVIDDTNLDHDLIMDWLDQRLADLSANEFKLLELLSSPQQQPKAYYFGLIDMFRALD